MKPSIPINPTTTNFTDVINGNNKTTKAKPAKEHLPSGRKTILKKPTKKIYVVPKLKRYLINHFLDKNKAIKFLDRCNVFTTINCIKLLQFR